MERVLKRVGLSKRTQSEIKIQNAMSLEEPTKIRRRRRSKSRRRTNPEGKKTRGLFNIDWESVKDCKSCKSRAITRRLCSKRCDNELYRSNSFKFERFVRGEETSTLGKKVSLCDDYSLPVDHLNKRRPNSIAAPNLSEWNVSSPNEEKIEVLETYSNPRDSRQQLSQEDSDIKSIEIEKRPNSMNKRDDEGSSEPSSDEDFFGHHITLVKPQELNSPDSITEAILPLVQSPTRNDVKRHPSPYYYGDLYKSKADESPSKPNTYKKSLSLDKSEGENSAPSRNSACKGTETDYLLTQNLDNQKTFNQIKYWKSSSLDTPNIDEPFRAKQFSQLYSKKSSSIDTQSTDSRDAANDTVMPPNRLTSPCACFTPDDGLDDDMTRQRHVYETAFDCRVNKSDDDLDQIDKVSNHPVLVQLNGNKTTRLESCYQTDSTSNCYKVAVICPLVNQNDNNSISALSHTLQDMQLEPAEETSTTSGALSLRLRGYTPSPPSTAPLPTKFHGKDIVMNSIRSAPNLPSHQKLRLKDLRLPIKSLRGRSSASSSGSLQAQGSIFDIEFGAKNNMSSEFKGWPGHKDNLKVEKERILEIKDRPRKDLLLLKRPKDLSKSSVLDFKERRRYKYSSTESITTSSSGGSMESIRSSTSEGNRSTTSSESHHSSSLSSHDSDSGTNTGFSVPQAGFLAHTNKLHILSPISDKSSQEPISETSDINRNNNSQKCSPDEMTTPENTKTKRRVPQNKNLLNLGFHTGDPEIQGSDSGISIQSREGITSRFGFTAELSITNQQDFPDLPFDMPKLRRRRIMSQDACTSGSATSVDLRDLPFDMPKLRRRLRIQQSSTESSVSQASSSQSVVEADIQGSNFRPKLTLNLTDVGKRHRIGLGLGLVGLRTHNTASSSSVTNNSIDVNLPLEKQAWFHGAITRVEAETVLRLLKEGSYLVRNSESTRQDYSLSLKSARGFMHMRIQRDSNDGSFILGQFSKPFSSIPEMIRHFSLNRLPIRGAEHMCLIQPVIAQLL
ncbi:hypothetical protein RI129_011500 [Pyrocoelia pectoralis]|uniref:SH2 domain-containing adapter protein D n=1 Tax=Pyrocoelia pectoralis TaxID=417401 RepID=A0AAN7ZH24_9COLE